MLPPTKMTTILTFMRLSRRCKVFVSTKRVQMIAMKCQTKKIRGMMLLLPRLELGFNGNNSINYRPLLLLPPLWTRRIVLEIFLGPCDNNSIRRYRPRTMMIITARCYHASPWPPTWTGIPMNPTIAFMILILMSTVDTQAGVVTCPHVVRDCRNCQGDHNNGGDEESCETCFVQSATYNCSASGAFTVQQCTQITCHRASTTTSPEEDDNNGNDANYNNNAICARSTCLLWEFDETGQATSDFFEQVQVDGTTCNGTFFAFNQNPN